MPEASDTPATPESKDALTADEVWGKAKKACLDLLAARPRSTDELRQALRRKGFDEEIREKLLTKLDSSGLIDDTAFAESWARSRHRQQGMARSAVVAELKRKGVDESVAATAAAGIGRDDEEQRARELVRKRLRGMRGLDEQTTLRRLLGMLARKGYSQGLSYVVIREELRGAGCEAALLDEAGAGSD